MSQLTCAQEVGVRNIWKVSATPSPLDRSVCFALYATMHATLGLYRDLLAPWGITYQQALVLALLWDREPCSPGELADHLALDASSVTGLLNRMERAGLLTRTLDPRDRRRFLVRSTELSRDLRAQLGWVEDCVAEAISFDSTQTATLLRELGRLRENISTYPHHRTPVTTES